MTERIIIADARRTLIAAFGLALLLLALFYALAPRGATSAYAQGTLRLDITKTLQGSNVVRVGEYLTFTIRITNSGTLTVTRLPVIDQYESNILRLDATAPLSSTNVVTPATGGGLITWADLTRTFGPIPPGASLTIVTRFRAIAPKPATVNHARIQDAVASNGARFSSGDAQHGGESVGGQTPMRKTLMTDTLPLSGLPLTFTIAISNDGAADIVRLPLRDTYQKTYLQFWKAIPPPTSVDTTTSVITGELRWDDVLPGLGLSRLRPGQTVTVTTVYTALKSFDGSVNHAAVSGAQDEFNNTLAARETEVPIRILPGPGEATPTRTPAPREEAPTPTPVTPTPTVVTATVGLTPTEVITAGVVVSPTAGPLHLPNTGGSDGAAGWLLAGLALLLGGALALLYRRGLAE